MAIHGASSPSSSSSAPISRWDVFLSFRGEDTRKNFTAHLCANLRQKGIQTFMDDKLNNGEEISLELVKAIEESKISIIVLSKNYASSRWCLDELMKIFDCRTRGQQVLPLFYDVTPSEVRNQTTSVGEAFAELKKRYKDDEKKVNEWKTALKKVADLSGKYLENYRNEPECIWEIIEWVNSILVKKTHFQVAQYPIRTNSHVEYLKSYLEDLKPHVEHVKRLLNIENDGGVRMVGIFGTGGIGKTTIAIAVYNSIASQFQHSCFLGNIGETSRQTDGLIRLQKELLSKILEESSFEVNHVDEGITLIKERLHNLRVLLVLDGVNQFDHLTNLAGKDDWFGLGSRIVVTTTKRHLLYSHGIYITY